MGRILHQARYEQLVFWRNRSGVFFTFVFPVMLLVLLGLALGRGDGGPERLEFVATGVIAMGVASVAFQALAIAVAYHRDMGILKTLVATPLSPGGLVAAKVLSVGIVTLLEVAVLVVVAVVVLGIALPAQLPALLAAVVVGIGSMAALGMAVATRIPSGEAAPALTNAIYLPLVFISGVFFPIDGLPRAIEAVGTALPLHHLVELVRASYLGGTPALGWGMHHAILVAWTVAGIAVAVGGFRWEPRYASGRDA